MDQQQDVSPEAQAGGGVACDRLNTWGRKREVPQALKLERSLPTVPLFDAGAPSDLLAAFDEQLEQISGALLTPGEADPLAPVHDKLASVKVVCSYVPEVAGNKALDAGIAPTDLADVDYGIVLLDPADIVPNTYHAHRRPERRERHHAVFQTGPSATADIEGVRSIPVPPLARG